MGRRKKVVSPLEHLYHREPTFTTPEGRVIEAGEVIKIKGIWGTKFQFKEYVQRTDDLSKEWIDCFELEKGQLCGHRSFRTDLVKPLPKTRRKRRKKSQV
jgi:hypothetical protein